MKIAFLGTGNMGTAMVRNLLRAGHEVTVYNRTAAKAAPLLTDGASLANSPAEAARQAEVVITMLANDEAVRQAIFGAAMDAMGRDTVHMCCSTISVELSRELAKEHALLGQNYIASPVLGRPEAAAEGKLWLIVAGSSKYVEYCRPVIDALGRGFTKISEQAWQAHMVKIGANLVIASMLETLGESFALMRKAKIPVNEFLEVVNGLFQSPVYGNYGKMIAEEKYEPAGFKLKLGLKDANLALAAGAEQDTPMPLASLLRDHYLEAIAHGYGERDWSAVALVSAENAGLTDGRRW